MKKRIEHIDTLKGIGILLMIMGHIGYGGIFDWYIHAFHMPLFFIISGFLMNTDKINVKDVILKKFKNLIVPYISFSIVHCLIFEVLTGGVDSAVIRSVLFFNNEGMPIAGALWFLTALFFAEVIYVIIEKNISENYAKNIIFITIMIIGICLPQISSNRLPYTIDAGLVGIGGLFIGQQIKRCSKKNENIKNLLSIRKMGVIILFIINSILIFANGYINMRTGEYANLILFLINAIVAFIVYYNIAKLINNRFICIDKLLRFIGENSIVYVCLNQIVILGTRAITNFFFKEDIFIITNKIIIIIGSLICLFIATIVINKTYLKVLIGKNNKINRIEIPA